MRRQRMVDGAWLLLLSLAACPPGSGADAGGDGDAGNVFDSGGDGYRPAAEYCAHAADVFCPFYLRCGRIAEDTPEGCRSTFVESCQAKYQPIYVALEQAGLLRLSIAGLSACANYLADVECDHQLLDLEGPCREIWSGQSAAGAACGISVESFVCDGATTCVLDLSFCGSCEAAAPTGGACSTEVHCRFPDLCVSEQCVGPAYPGDACSDTQRCNAGASCDNDVCVARQFVGPGATCDSARRCVYRASCVGGSCSRDALLGEACSASVRCASGHCAASGRCEPFGAPDAGCDSGATCLASSCTSGRCDGLLSACLQ